MLLAFGDEYMCDMVTLHGISANDIRRILSLDPLDPLLGASFPVDARALIDLQPYALTKCLDPHFTWYLEVWVDENKRN